MCRLIKDYTATETCVRVTITYLGYLICLFCVIYQGIDCVQRLISKPEAIDLAYGFQAKYAFPALTFCPIQHHKKLKDAQHNPKGSEPPGPWPYDLKAWKECNNNDDLLGIFINYPGPNKACMRKNLYKRSLVKWQDFKLIDIDIKTWTGDPGDKNNFANSASMSSWNQMNHGTCFTMNFKQEIMDQGIWFVRIIHEFNIKYTLTIHTPGTLQNPINSLGGVALTISPGEVSNHVVDYESVTLLHYDGVPCNPDPEYNLDQCTLDYVDNYLLQTIGCATPLGNYSDSDTACSNLEAAKTAQLFYKKNILETSTKCPYACNTLWSKITYSKIANVKGTKTELTLNFPKFIKASHARYTYETINFIGEYGGVIGLFLGLSFMQLTDVLIWLSREIIHWASRYKTIDLRSGKKGSKKGKKSAFNRRSANSEATLRTLSKIDTD